MVQPKHDIPDSPLEVDMSIRHLFISSGHNFFGHHGREPGWSVNIEVAEVECLVGRGIRGARFLDYRANYNGQVTFFRWRFSKTFAVNCGSIDFPLRSFAGIFFAKA